MRIRRILLKIKTKDIRPKQLSAEEVKAKVREIIAQVGATSIKDMGKVMGAANKALAGQSDGRSGRFLILDIQKEKSRGIAGHSG